jgi:EmrB/QacA subfamily drug resistance transporter
MARHRAETSFTRQQRLVLAVAVLASFVSFLDGSIVNVALPAIARDVGGGLQVQQWVVNAYLLTLVSFMLLAGSLSDILGRRKILELGLIGFAVTSLLCGVAPSGGFLVAMRALQGAAGALLVPSSLALIMASFEGPAEGEAIGKWTSWTVVAAVVGPLLGGFLVDAASWRLIFGINVIPIAVTLWLMRLLEHADKADKQVRVDATGAALSIVGLAAVTYALTEQPHVGWRSPMILLPLVTGIVALLLFAWHEHRESKPMLPLRLFSIRNFGMGNLATLFIYAGLTVAMFLITIFVQQIADYSAFIAGLTFLPVTGLMFLLSTLFGRLAGKLGPRIFMTLGPLVSGAGILLMLGMDDTVSYWTDLFPGVVLFGLGLSITVAPLTAAILGAISKKESGIGSATNNAVSRLAGLIAVAALGIIVGPELTVSGFQKGLWFIALLLGIGGVVSALGISNAVQSRAGAQS